MVMTIGAGLDCHALKISLQQLTAGIPAQHLGVIVNAVCGNGAINKNSAKIQTKITPFSPFPYIKLFPLYL